MIAGPWWSLASRMPRIRFTNLFAERIGGVSAVDVPATTVALALRALTDRHGELTPLVWTKDGAVNPVMVVFLNDRQLGAAEMGTSVAPGDEIDIVPALEGG
jgi:molybdopterin converting factor small subunit